MEERNKVNIFYSWQSDLIKRYNQNFIEDCIKKSIKNINKENIQLELNLDRDTKNRTGSVDIADTILKKIENSQIFIADISFIDKPKLNDKSKRLPNPNVLIELGYASALIGWQNIIMIFNSSYGNIEDLPFDIRGRRILNYCFNENTEDKNDEKKKLVSNLEGAIKPIDESIFNLQNNPVVKIFRFISNRISYLLREVNELKRALNIINDNQLKLSEMDIICENIQRSDSVEFSFGTKLFFNNWIEYLYYKTKNMQELVKDALRFKENIDFSIVGYLSEVYDSLLNIKLCCDMSMPYKDNNGNILGTLDIFSDWISDLIINCNVLFKNFRRIYKQHNSEFHKQEREKNIKSGI